MPHHHQPPEEPSGVLIDLDDEVYAALLAHRDALTRAARRAVSFGETIQHLIDNNPAAQQVLTGHAHPSGPQATRGTSPDRPALGRTDTPGTQDGGDRRRAADGHGDGHPPAP